MWLPIPVIVTAPTLPVPATPLVMFALIPILACAVPIEPVEERPVTGSTEFDIIVVAPTDPIELRPSTVRFPSDSVTTVLSADVPLTPVTG